MKKFIYIIALILLAQISLGQVSRKATDFPGDYISNDKPGDPLYSFYRHEFHQGNNQCDANVKGYYIGFNNDHYMFAASTGGDAAGRDIDSIMFFIDSLAGSFNCIWGLHEKSEGAGQLGKRIALQDAAMTVSARGMQSATGWTMESGQTLSNYTMYWLIIEHNAISGDAVKMPIGDIMTQRNHQHITYSNSSPFVYDGAINDSADFLVPLVMSAGQVERMPVYMMYVTTDALDYNLTKTVSNVTSTQFSLNVDWDNDDANMSAYMYGAQGLYWIQDFPTMSLNTWIDTLYSWGVPDSIRIIDTTGIPPLFAAADSGHRWDQSHVQTDSITPLVPGIPFKGQLTLEYNNGNYFTDVFIDTLITVRIKNIFTNNHVSTDTMGTDSLNLWAHPDSAGTFNPTQEDSITIKTGDVLHIIQPLYGTDSCIFVCEDADFDGNSDTTFANLNIESGGTLEMHGGTRINILTYTNNGTITMTATDTIAVAHGAGWSFAVGEFVFPKKFRAVHLREVSL